MEAVMQEVMKSTKDMQTYWENQFAQYMEELVKSQSFVDAMTRSLDSSLDMRRLLDSSMGRWAEFYQIVTKKDLAQLQQQIYDQGARTEKMLNVLTEIRDLLARPQVVAPPKTEDSRFETIKPEPQKPGKKSK